MQYVPTPEQQWTDPLTVLQIHLTGSLAIAQLTNLVIGPKIDHRAGIKETARLPMPTANGLVVIEVLFCNWP